MIEFAVEDMNMTTPMKLLTAKQVADKLQFPVKEVYRRDTGVPGRVILGGRTRWVEAAIDKWIAECMLPEEPDPDEGLTEA